MAGTDLAVPTSAVAAAAGLAGPVDGTYRVDRVPATVTQVRAATRDAAPYSSRTVAQAGQTVTVPKIVLSPSS